MFNLQGSEIIIIMLLALVVLGPEKLPDAMRKMGQAYAELKKMSTGFQNEFRAAVDEPMRELRDTANALRDSADFTKLQDGEREEKPKSGEMAAVDPNDVPADEVPTFESPGQDPSGDGPDASADSKPAPFDEPTAERTDTGPTAIPTPPPPFTGMSAPRPAPEIVEAPDLDPVDDAPGVGDDAVDDAGETASPDTTDDAASATTPVVRDADDEPDTTP